MAGGPGHLSQRKNHDRFAGDIAEDVRMLCKRLSHKKFVPLFMRDAGGTLTGVTAQCSIKRSPATNSDDVIKRSS